MICKKHKNLLWQWPHSRITKRTFWKYRWPGQTPGFEEEVQKSFLSVPLMILYSSQPELRAKFYSFSVLEILNQWLMSLQFCPLQQLPLNMSWDYLFILPKYVHNHASVPSSITLSILCSSHFACEPSEQGIVSDAMFSTVSRTLALRKC